MKKSEIIKKNTLDFDIDYEKLWALDIQEESIAIDELLWHFDIPFWDKEGTDDWNLTPWEFIKNQNAEPSHKIKVNEANLDYPIDVFDNDGKITILDGLHRLVKAYTLGYREIKVRMIPKEMIISTIK